MFRLQEGSKRKLKKSLDKLLVLQNGELAEKLGNCLIRCLLSN
jgi:hypothetical protein